MVDPAPADSAFDTLEFIYLPYTSGQFTTVAVSITGPASLSTDHVAQTSATVDWSSASDNGYPIAGYNVQYRQDGALTWISAGSTSSNSITFQALQGATSYDVEVDAMDSAGNVGNWSVAMNLFTTASLPAPTLLAPADKAVGLSTTPTFSWQPVSGADDGYNMIVDTSAADLPANPAGAAGPSAVFSSHITGTTEALVNALQDNTTYYWEVQGVGADGTHGQWSAIESFTPGGLIAPTLTSPTNQGTGLSDRPAFAWNPLAGLAGGYNIIVDSNPADLPSSPSGVAGATAVFSTYTTGTSAMPTDALQPSTTYYWEVQAVGSSGVPGPWSSIGSFTTSGPQLTVLFDGQVIQSGQGIANPADVMDFGSAIHGTSSPVETFTIANTGDKTLTLGRLQVPQGFTVVSEPPRSVAAGHVATFKLRMKTTEDGTFGGVVNLPSNDLAAGDDPFTFAISGSVIPKPAPAVTVAGNGQTIQSGRNPASSVNGTDFGSVDQNSADVSNTFTIENTGNAVLTIGAIKVPRGFVVVAQPPRSIAPGDSATFTIGLNTTRAGTFGGLVSFSTNDPQPGPHPFAFMIHGVVIAGTPHLTVSGNGQPIESGQGQPSPSDATDFGTVPQGAAAVVSTFTIQNTGNAALVLGVIKAPPGYTVVTRPPRSIAAGASATFTLRLNTRKSGTFAGLVSLSSNDPQASQFSFAVTGIVTPPAASIG